MAPSCVPASHFESPVGPFGPDEMRPVLEHPRALGVAELMNFPGVIAGDPDVLARMVAPHRGRALAGGARARAERVRRRRDLHRP